MRSTLIALALSCAGCYATTISDGVYLCPDQICPDGLACNACGVCVQASEALDARSSCPADMSASASCAGALLCVHNCAMGDMACVQGCKTPLSPAQAMALDAVINCVEKACAMRCPGLTCVACRKNAQQQAGTCATPDPACGACFMEYSACAKT